MLSLFAIHHIEPQERISYRLRMRFEDQNAHLPDVNEEPASLSSIDPLCGIANRRALDREVLLAWTHAQEHNEPMALLMMDLDGFKELNDANGHAYGDAVLVLAARTIRGRCVPTRIFWEGTAETNL